ncbi:MAG: GNAT family N-acetyltransferase [Candidatus Gracilibacteria bacterium]|nr:GNAT family N-acetyltransferase [Candidatus Gracilibacteria bacterium]
MKPHFPQPNPQKTLAQLEEEILVHWKKERIFEKTLEYRGPHHSFRFFDGPPFATGTPHYGHILAGTIKDVIPRYWTMKGYRVERKWGWDCHGVPVEFQVEKEHKIGGKPGIEKMGVGKFNELCRSVVMRCADEWEHTVERMGRFVDFKNDYKTMDPEFMESVWWVFSELWKKDLIYEGEKVIPYSPKLGSPLSNFEANLNYKDISDPAVTLKFPLVDDPQTSILAWTTTPWTLPSNLGLCVNPKLLYVRVRFHGEQFLLGQSLVEAVFGKKNQAEVEILETIPGKELIGKKYVPLFDFFADLAPNVHQIHGDGYVSDEDGTGIVHIAPTGEDDARILSAAGIPLVYPFDDHGFFDETIPPLAGKYFRDDPEVPGSLEDNANDWVLKNLGDKLWKKESVTHSYPHCWRTDCALMYRGVKTWFVNIQKIKDTMLAKNQEINWVPEHLKDGRFGKLLADAPDWAISRNRYWGAPIPVWRCDKCGELVVVSSRAELETLTGKKVSDLHKHFVDELHFSCSKCDGTMTRIPEVLDCWFESGAMPYASNHFPFEQQKDVEVREVKTDEDWKNFHNILKTEIFDKFRSEVPYNPDHESFQQGTAFLFSQKGIPVATGRIELDPQKKERAFLWNFAVKQSFQGQGVGSGVLQKLEYWAVDQGVREIVFNANPKAVKFYQKNGYETDFWEGDFSHDKDSVPLGKKIQPPTDSGQAEKTEQTLDFPAADFIAEGLDQTRGWFYTLHVLGCALFGKNIFKNVVTNGIVLAEDGHKMSKSKKNYPDPKLIFDQYGADAMRYYLLSSPVVRGENFRFTEKGVEEVLKQVILPLKNAYQFFSTYANVDRWKPTKFIFVRHGEGDHNVAGIYSGDRSKKHHLTETGKAQAKEVAQKLGAFDLMIASPFIRTQETAEILKKETGFSGKIMTDERVRELSFGDLEGKKMVSSPLRMANPTTESPEELQKRVREFLREMGEKYPGKTIVVISHGATIRAADAVLNGITAREDLLFIPMARTAEAKRRFPLPQPENELDQWILSVSQESLQEFRKKMDVYDLEGALREISPLIDQLNNWYLRRSRQRFWAEGLEEDKQKAYETLHYLLLTFSKILAPVCPFFAEQIFQNLGAGDSVHLAFFPHPQQQFLQPALERKVALEREIVALAAKIRARKQIKLRQPLPKLQFLTTEKISLDRSVIQAEANVKSVELLSEVQLEKVARRVVRVNARMVGKKLGKKVQEVIRMGKSGEFSLQEDGSVIIARETLLPEEFEFGFVTTEGVEAEGSATAVVLLDTEINEALRLEGIAREIIRAIQEQRRDQGFALTDRIVVDFCTVSEDLRSVFAEFSQKISEEVLALKVSEGHFEDGEVLEIEGNQMRLKLTKKAEVETTPHTEE